MQHEAIVLRDTLLGSKNIEKQSSWNNKGRGSGERGCMMFGRRMKGLLGCRQFLLFIDPGSGYMVIYLEIIILCFCFAHSLICMVYFIIKKLRKTPPRRFKTKRGIKTH